MRRFNAMPVRTSRCARVPASYLNQSIAHFPKCVGSEQLSVRPLGIFKNRGSVDGELLVYVKDAFLAACSRVHYKKGFFIFCRAHAGYVLVLTHWPGLDTYGSSPAYHK